jgi:antitoxin component of MazEF toxin-antitoxin module
MSVRTYNIRTADIATSAGVAHRQYAVTIPNEIAKPLEAAGFTHVTYEVTDAGVLMIPVRLDNQREGYGDVSALVANLTNREV